MSDLHPRYHQSTTNHSTVNISRASSSCLFLSAGYVCELAFGFVDCVVSIPMTHVLCEEHTLVTWGPLVKPNRSKKASIAHDSKRRISPASIPYPHSYFGPFEYIAFKKCANIKYYQGDNKVVWFDSWCQLICISKMFVICDYSTALGSFFCAGGLSLREESGPHPVWSRNKPTDSFRDLW